ncbi:hypothetical protein K440DRAFT_664757 [Wilcoxina mikolae CBS 423.85]|nr:hypothetical protein K440DRAFT_664757 [Wilcoxina mikolae CBS 423.85]
MAEYPNRPLKIMNPDIDDNSDNNEEVPSHEAEITYTVPAPDMLERSLPGVQELFDERLIEDVIGASIATRNQYEDNQPPPNTPVLAPSTPEIKIIGPEDDDGEGGVSMLHTEQYQPNNMQTSNTPSLRPVAVENDQQIDPLFLSVPGGSSSGPQKRCLPVLEDPEDPEDPDDSEDSEFRGYPLKRTESHSSLDPVPRETTPPPAYEEAAVDSQERTAEPDVPLILLRIPCVRSSLAGAVHFHPLFDWEVMLPPPRNLLSKIKSAEGRGVICKIQPSNILCSRNFSGEEAMEEVWDLIEHRLASIYDKWYLGWDENQKNGVWAAEWREEGNKEIDPKATLRDIVSEILEHDAPVVVIGLRNLDPRSGFGGMSQEESTGPGVPPPNHDEWR